MEQNRQQNRDFKILKPKPVELNVGQKLNKKRSTTKRGNDRLEKARAFNMSALEEDISNPMEEYESKFESD